MTMPSGLKWMLGTVVVAAMAVTAVGNAALAREKMTKAEVLAGYERSGEMHTCVSLQQLRHSRILDNKTILFESVGKTAYLNEMPFECPQLKSMDAYAHKTSVNSMCSTDLITVIDTTLDQRLGSCSLGKFERLTEKPKED